MRSHDEAVANNTANYTPETQSKYECAHCGEYHPSDRIEVINGGWRDWQVCLGCLEEFLTGGWWR
jgi:formylmethanofuran dehydrogenase subunit E